MFYLVHYSLRYLLVVGFEVSLVSVGVPLVLMMHDGHVKISWVLKLRASQLEIS